MSINKMQEVMDKTVDVRMEVGCVLSLAMLSILGFKALLQQVRSGTGVAEGASEKEMENLLVNASNAAKFIASEGEVFADMVVEAGKS